MRRGNNFGPTWGTEDGQTSGNTVYEAPDDGRQYVRMGGAWVPVPYASNAEVAEGVAEGKVVQPSNIGNLLSLMGIRWDEELGQWINDQGGLGGGGFDMGTL